MVKAIAVVFGLSLVLSMLSVPILVRSSSSRWLLPSAAAVSSTHPTISWSPSSIELTVKAGDSTSASATFTALKALSNVKVKVVPGITGFVTPSHTSIPSVSAGGSVTVNLVISIPASTAPGDYNGSLQVSAQGKNQPKPLPVIIHVQKSCTPGTIGCPWDTGDLTTYSQAQWGSGGTANSLLVSDYATVYAGTAGGFEIGSGLSGGFTALWTDVTILSTYLPATGPPGALTADHVDATSTEAGQFGGDVAALKLNIDFADAGFLSASSGLKFGDLTVCGVTPDRGLLNDQPVRGALVLMNIALAGGPTGYSITELDAVAAQLDGSFDDGTPSTWAQQHLVNGACGTYNQAFWGRDSGTAHDLLLNDYSTVYASAGGLFIIGDPSKYIIEFDSGEAVNAFLPQGGPVGVLTGTLFDPTSSASGAFGGDTAALKLNIDFSDFGLLEGTSGLAFGDLTICGLTSDTGLNGMTVRQFLVMANSVLGAASTSYPATDLDAIEIELTNTFFDGVPSTWAQDHLVNGACP